MSTYSDAWRDTPPATRDFYHNFHRYTGMARYPDFDFGPNWTKRSGAPWNAYNNWTWQTADTGSFNPAIVIFVEDWIFGYLDPTIPGDAFNFYNYTDTIRHVLDWAFDYPRDKQNVRRTYWTGKPRRRRNL